MSEPKRGTGKARKTEFVRARVSPTEAEAVDRACLLLREPLSVFIRRALSERARRILGAPGQ